MIVLGVILALFGYLLGIPIVGSLGIILIVLGLVLWFVPIGGTTRRYY